MAMTPAQHQLLESMTHAEVITDVLTEAERHGWSTYAPKTTHTSQDKHLTPYEQTPLNTGKGFPDITCIGMCWVLFIEVKTGTGRLEPDQRRWRDLALSVEEHNPASRVLHAVLRPTGLPALRRFLESGRREDLT